MKPVNNLIIRKRNNRIVTIVLLLAFLALSWKDLKKGFHDGFMAAKGKASAKWIQFDHVTMQAGDTEFMLSLTF